MRDGPSTMLRSINEPLGSQTGRVLTRVVVCHTHPIIAYGLRALIDSCPDCNWVCIAESLEQGKRLVDEGLADVLIVDKNLAAADVIDWLAELQSVTRPPRVIVIGTRWSKASSCRFLRAGAAGTLETNSSLDTIRRCVAAVAADETW